MVIEITSADVDELPQQATPSTPENSTITPTDPNAEGINTTPRAPGPVPLVADDVDSLPPGLMRKPAHPDQSQSVIDHIRQKHPDFGKRVRVNGVEGTAIGRHPESKKLVVHWDE